MSVTSPYSGAVWIVGAQQNITWTKSGTFLNGNFVELQYSTNGGISFPNVITASTAAGTTTGSYSWTIPDAIGTTLQVKVSDADVSDPPTSAASVNFQIKGSLTLTAPNGGQVWIVGASQAITWTETGTTGMGNVDLSYSINGGKNYLQNNAISTNTVAYSAGSYTWTIPNAISSQASVKIADHLDAYGLFYIRC